MNPMSGCRAHWKNYRSIFHGEGTRHLSTTLCWPLGSIHIDWRHCCDSGDGAGWPRVQGHERSGHRPAYRSARPEGTYSPKSLDLDIPLAEIIHRIAQAYELEAPQA